MARLKSRQLSIPFGFKFIQPETGWQPRPHSSFTGICQALRAHRIGNPHLAAKHKWATDMADIEAEVEAFNANICVQMGWTDYLMSPPGEPPPPKTKPPSQAELESVSAAAGRTSKIWAGVRTLNDWIDSGTPPVPVEQAEARASVCAKCPKNGKGDFTRWFTQPAAEAIRRQMEKVTERSLSTSRDKEINVCEVCLCPMRLKVHTPLDYIRAHMTDKILDDLRAVDGCWIPEELSRS